MWFNCFNNISLTSLHLQESPITNYSSLGLWGRRGCIHSWEGRLQGEQCQLLPPGQQGSSNHQLRQRSLPPAGGDQQHCQGKSVVRAETGSSGGLMGNTGCGQDTWVTTPARTGGQGTLERKGEDGSAADSRTTDRQTQREKTQKYNYGHVHGGSLWMMDLHGILFSSLYSSVFSKVSIMTTYSPCTIYF